MFTTRQFLFLVFVVCQSLMASTIPNYQINAIDQLEVVLNNQARLKIQEMDASIVQLWQVGDTVFLSLQRNMFPTIVTQTTEGFPALYPHVFINNVTRDTRATAVVIEPPQTAPVVTFVDSVNMEVTLSDATVWKTMPVHLITVGSWQVGDPVLIGKNDTFIPSEPEVDAFALNAFKQNFIYAHE